MKILIVSSNTLPAAPTGPAYIAGALLRAGHSVRIFECLFAQDAAGELAAEIEQFQPDVVGISIRLVYAYLIDPAMPFNTRRLDLRPAMRQVVEAVRGATDAPIVLGGPGFNYYARDWLDYLGLDSGIIGEADFAFPLYLDLMRQGGDLACVPGCVYRQDGRIHENPRDRVADLDETAFPAYHLLDMAAYQQRGISPGVLTKRGCAFGCTYCPYRELEGAAYRLKSPGRVVDEVEAVQRAWPAKMIMFCENNFNAPRRHAEAICKEIIARGKGVAWGTGDLRPMRITPDFCKLMRDSGCVYLNLSIESASDTMLRQMRRGYTVKDIRQSLDCLSEAGIPFGASLMLGAPGETPRTIQETLDVIDAYAVPLGVWTTIGICLWTPLQKVLVDARRDGQLADGDALFDGINYLSPRLERPYMEDLISSLRARAGFSVQVNQPYPGFRW